MERHIPGWAHHGVACLWFAGLASAVFWQVVLQAEVLYYGDIMLYFHPMLRFVQDWLLQGIIPLWNPHTLFGQPFVGNPQEFLFYPTTLLVGWLGAERAISWGALFHLAWAGIGVYAFARRRDYGFGEAVVAGSLWALSGAVVLRSQHITILQTLAWYGWSLWALEGLLQKPAVCRAFPLSLILAISSLAGSPQVFHMLILLLVAWGAYRWRYAQQKRATLLWGGIAVAVAMLVGGAHWLPLFELLRYTDRDSLPLKESGGYAFRPDYLLLFLMPDLYGFPWQGNYFRGKFYWELAFFVGTVPILVALAAWRRATGEERFWKWVIIFSLWMALGPAGGLYLIAYYLIPGMQSFRTPLRWTAVTDLAICLWSARYFFSEFALHQRWWRLPAGVLLIALVWKVLMPFVAQLAAPGLAESKSLTQEQALALARTMGEVIQSALWRAAAMSFLAVGMLRLTSNWRWWICFAITLVELLRIAIPANPTCSAQVFWRVPPTAQAMQSSGERLFVANTSPIWERYVDPRDFGSPDTSRLWSWRETLASNIGMAHGVSEASGYEPAPLASSWQRYLHLCDRWRRDEQLLRYSGVGAVASGATAEEWRVQQLKLRGYRAWLRRQGTAVSWYSASPQEISLHTREQGTVVLADSAYPGWRAWVNGQPQAWHVYEGAFRAVEVREAGSHIVWRYQPDTFRVGLFLSGIGLALLAGMGSYAFATRRQ